MSFNSKARRIIFAAAIIMTLLFCVLFSSCNDDVAAPQQSKLSLYIQSLEYEEETLAITAKVTIDSSERELPCTADYSRTVEKDGEFWNIYSTHLKFDCDILYACVENAISDGERNYESNFYSDLKIVFDYATIYKSTTSDGNLIIEGKNYHHLFFMSNTGEQTVTLNRRSPNSAAWYGVLISVGLAIIFVVAAVTTTVGGKNGRQN